MSENNNYLLLEGKRDNQLLPYLQAFNEKTGNNLSLGNFKTMMLRKLSFEGGIHNVSLQSNYYLAGCVRYYFEGLLTNNKDLSVFKEGNAADDWNVQVCKSLNALILVLRNGFIDSIGTSWLEPEDFGTLNLIDLFKKYKKEIKKVLDKETNNTINEPAVEGGEEVPDYVMQNPEYTYDIIYKYNDAVKYCNATAPGSWCITYGLNHLRFYTSQGNGHFVIFRRNGYEKIPRKKEPEKWIGTKPQDDYGNSLIAFLQDNNTPGPANYCGAPLITSRWNHGADGIDCEADRAYTFDEFKKITGVSNADLKGIYDTWKRNKYKYGDNDDTTKRSQKFKLTPDELRTLKYVQIRINGGEDPANFFAGYDPKKICCLCTYNFEQRGELVSVLVSGKKIFFETACEQGDTFELWSTKGITCFKIFGNSEKGFLFNNLTKDIIRIQGQWIFKAVPHARHTENSYIEVKLSNKDIALVDNGTGRPVRLPNGQYFFNYIFGEGVYSNEHGRVVCATFEKHYVYEIIYDESSGEKYFFNSRTGKFVDVVNDNPEKQNVYLVSSFWPGPDKFAVSFSEYSRRNRWYYDADDRDDCYIFDANGNRDEYTFELSGITYKLGNNGPEDAYRIEFGSINNVNNSNGILKIKLEYIHCVVIYDLPHKKLINNIKGNPIVLPVNEAYSYNRGVMGNENLLFIGQEFGGEGEIDDRESTYFYYMFDTNTGRYIKNPYEYPSKYVWFIADFTYLTFVERGYKNVTEIRTNKLIGWLDRDGGHNSKNFNQDDAWEEYVRDKRLLTRFICPATGNIYKKVDMSDDYDKKYEVEYNIYTNEGNIQQLNESSSLLLEGKRDNQLIPYWEIYNEKSENKLSLGQFKTMMLQKLSSEGNIHNLSLASNFYLAGAVKYYFSGELTLNKDFSVFTDPTQPDQWDVNNCAKLNALILILRNEYIGTVGETWTEPEDFGTMPIKQLFKKYANRIKTVIRHGVDGSFDISQEKKNEVAKPVFENKDYDYDVIFSFDDAVKYCNATSPGSWCITYGENHLNSYTKIGHGHFVVFKKKGYENIPRNKEPEKWIGSKPQDDYGNSLIAYLQDNNGPGPANYRGAPLITSRWNHGANGIYCEADRAYTQEEFERITGYNMSDLKKIYDYWKANKPEEGNVDLNGKVPKDAVLALKYLQMRLNGGENIVNNGSIRLVHDNIYTITFNGEVYYFLFNGKKMFFETISKNDWECVETSRNYENLRAYSSQIGGRSDIYYIIYNTRLRRLLYVDDVCLFKDIGLSNGGSSRFFEVAKSRKTIALFDSKSFSVVRLPNGQKWYNTAKGAGLQYRYQNRTDALAINDRLNSVALVYDESSRETYIFNPSKNRFINAPKLDGYYQCGNSYEYTYVNLPDEYEIVSYRKDDYQYGNPQKTMVVKNGEFTNFYCKVFGKEYKLFDDDNKNVNKLKVDYKIANYKKNEYIICNGINPTLGLQGFVLFNTEKLKFAEYDGEAILMEYTRQGGQKINRRNREYEVINNGKWLVCPMVLNIREVTTGNDVILNLEDGSLVENQLGFPEENSFLFAGLYNVARIVRDKFVCMWKYNPDRGYVSGYQIDLDENNEKFAYISKKDGSYYNFVNEAMIASNETTD